MNFARIEKYIQNTFVTLVASSFALIFFDKVSDFLLPRMALDPALAFLTSIILMLGVLAAFISMAAGVLLGFGIFVYVIASFLNIFVPKR